MPNPSKAKIAENAKLRDEIVEALKAGDMSTAQLKEKMGIEHLSLREFSNHLQHLVRADRIASYDGTKRTSHCNREKIYTLDLSANPKEPLKEIPLLCQVWPLPIPKTNAQPRVVKRVDTYHPQAGLTNGGIFSLGGTLGDMSRFPKHENF